MNPKRLATTNSDEVEAGYYDSTHRASTSSLTKSSNRSSPNSPAVDRLTNAQDTANLGPYHDKPSYRLEHHDDSIESEKKIEEHVISIKPETSAYLISKAVSIAAIVDNCETSWDAQLILRNFNFNSTLYMCSGQKSVVEKYINPSEGDKCIVLRITQRWRLHPQPKLEEVRRHMETGNLGIFIIRSRSDWSHQNAQDGVKTPQDLTKSNGESESANCEKTLQSGDTLATQPRPLKNLISYLEQKDAAGVVSVTHNDSEGHEHQKLLYTFPPCEFALNILKTVTPNLSPDELSKDEFLIGVLVKTIEAKV